MLNNQPKQVDCNQTRNIQMQALQLSVDLMCDFFLNPATELFLQLISAFLSHFVSIK